MGLIPAQALFDTGQRMPRGIAAKLARKVMAGLAFDEKRVYLTMDQPTPRRRFVHGHELGHKVLLWQERAYYADDDNTLNPDTRDASVIYPREPMKARPGPISLRRTLTAAVRH